MSPAPWPDDGSPETTPIRFRAHATIMMKTPDRRKANSVEMRMPRAIEWACDAMLPISLCPSRWAVGPTSGMRLSVAPRWYAQLDATACGCRREPRTKACPLPAPTILPRGVSILPSSLRPGTARRRSNASDLCRRCNDPPVTQPRLPCAGEVIRSHLVLDREGLLREARLPTCGAPQRARLNRHGGKRGHRSVDRP